MRKCRSCGYLLLGDGDSCGRCGTPLPAVSAAPAPIAAAARPLGRLSIPPPGGVPAAPIGSVPQAAPAPGPVLWPMPAPPPPAAPPPATNGPWAPEPASALPRKAPRRTHLGTVVLAAAVAVVVFVATTHLNSDRVPAGTSAFVAGGGVPYTSADGAFQVQLPAQPRIESLPITVDSISMSATLADVSGKDYEIAAGSIVLPVELPAANVDSRLDAMLTQGLSHASGSSLRKHRTTIGSRPAIEGSFKAPDGYAARLLIVYSGPTLVVLIVHSKVGADKLYKALEQSLIVS